MKVNGKYKVSMSPQKLLDIQIHFHYCILNSISSQDLILFYDIKFFFCVFLQHRTLETKRSSLTTDYISM